MKTILVIDKPNQCIECPCYRQTQGEKLIEWCNAKDMLLTWQEVVEVPKWCPLKPLPHTKKNDGGLQKMLFLSGWNACIKEITND